MKAEKSKAQARATVQSDVAVTASEAPSDEVTLPREAIAVIRRGLVIGLASFGEIERLENQQDLMKLCGEEVPEGLRLIHPTGRSDTVSEIAEAFAFLEMAEIEPDSPVEAANG